MSGFTALGKLPCKSHTGLVSSNYWVRRTTPRVLLTYPSALLLSQHLPFPGSDRRNPGIDDTLPLCYCPALLSQQSPDYFGRNGGIKIEPWLFHRKAITFDPDSLLIVCDYVQGPPNSVGGLRLLHVRLHHTLTDPHPTGFGHRFNK